MHEIWSFPSVTPVCMPYLGFTYNGCHSSEFGLYRVSSGDRYVTDLTATNEVKTIHVPGQEGSYYYGTEYKQKSFPLNIAFDELDETALTVLQMWLSNGVIADLILDEKPYKAYYAKAEGMQNLSVIPFNKWNKEKNIYETVYKGEGTITFTCYQPFAHNTFKYLDQFVAGEGTNHFNLNINKKVTSDFETNEWKNSVSLLPSKIIDGTEGQEQDGGSIRYDTSIGPFKPEGKPMRMINRYFNPGDLETYPYILVKIRLPQDTVFNGIKLIKYSNNPQTQQWQEDGNLIIYNNDGFIVKSDTQYHNFLIDTKTKNIEYWTDGGAITDKTKKQIVNKYINTWEGSDNFNLSPTIIKSTNDWFRLEVLKDGTWQENGIDFNNGSELQILYKYYYY